MTPEEMMMQDAQRTQQEAPFTVDTAAMSTPGQVKKQVDMELQKQAMMQEVARMQEREATVAMAEQDLLARKSAIEGSMLDMMNGTTGGLTGGVELEAQDAITALEQGADPEEIRQAISPQALAYLQEQVSRN